MYWTIKQLCNPVRKVFSQSQALLKLIKTSFIRCSSRKFKFGQKSVKRQVKGPVKLMQREKIALSYLQSLSNMFHFVILGLPIWFYIRLSKDFSKLTSKNGEIDRFHRSLLIESV